MMFMIISDSFYHWINGGPNSDSRIAGAMSADGRNCGLYADESRENWSMIGSRQ